MISIEPQLPHYFKGWGNCQIVESNNTVLFSSYTRVVPGFEYLVKKIIETYDREKISDMYVICPQYGKNESSVSDIVCFQDVQATVTGSPFVGEQNNAAAIRELHEETGLCVSSSSQLVASKHFLMGKKAVQNFLFNVDELSIATETGAKETSVSTQDDKTRKVQILVFGTKNTLISFFQNKIMPLESDDTKPSNTNSYIVGVRLISLVDIIRLCQIAFPQKIQSD